VREIVVVDSGSTDNTCEIARGLGARVIDQPWLGFGPQKQFAVERADAPWVLALDADEALSPELAREIAGLALDRDGYELPRRSWYLGRWIAHGTWSPDPVLRLFRRDRGRFTPDLVHESVELAGARGRLKGALDHWPYRDLAHHQAKIDALSTLQAERMFAAGRRAAWADLALKPGWEFFRSYVVKAGFLDGMPGLVAAGMHAHANFLKMAKLWRLASA
jgi:glycosyltransferase involved in cell wall biosynthesis